LKGQQRVAWSGRTRHRDRDAGHRRTDELPAPAAGRVFRITDAQRQEMAKALRYIDEARQALEAQQNRDNRAIIRELRASADRIFDLLNDLDEIVDERRDLD
jgi:hypothetical protein